MSDFSSSDSSLTNTRENLSEQEKRVIAYIDPAESVELLRSLIQARSDFPPGDCREAIGNVVRKLDQSGMPYQILKRQDHQPNLIVNIGPSSDIASLMFHSHIDTVPAGELSNWSVDPFAGIVRDGRIYGRGAGDDKSSVAAQAIACLALVRSGVSIPACLKLVVVSDEESGGMQGTNWLHHEGKLRTKALIVGEQTNNYVAVAERVACGIDLTVYGKSAHGATPWEGDNAILKTARVLSWLEEKLLPELHARTHPFLPTSTLNVGKIRGGNQWNIVPEKCVVEMDRRLLPSETREEAMAEIRSLLDEYSSRVEPLRYELSSDGEVSANIDTDPNSPFVQMAHSTLLDITGEERKLTGYVQTSDGRWFARDGIPILIFGPSKPALAHAADEYVTVDQLVEAAKFLAIFALRWLLNQNKERKPQESK
jgi:succinyl-diaminopimelate desuccinylase